MKRLFDAQLLLLLLLLLWLQQFHFKPKANLIHILNNLH
jgi:hypothetical protein